MELSRLFELEPHGPDTFVGIGPRYPWGGLFGGQIVAQALRAAAATVDADQQVHSLRAYFIRRGDHTEPIRFEVDRIRNGRSFSTRRVVARQAIGAILNLEASFQAPEATADVQPVPMDLGVPGPDELTSDAWSDAFDRRTVTSTDWGAYPILRFSEVPAVEARLIPRPELPPLGAGEASLAPAIAAIANAIHDALGIRGLVDLELRLGEGTGAALALPVVQAAARVLRDVMLLPEV